MTPLLILASGAVAVGFAFIVNRVDAYRFKRRRPLSDRMAVGD